jgi:putative tricarboxylic transport membrane protein
MADRILGCIALAITIAYGFFAFMVIQAPFQYDPLGPETWPQILSVVAGICCLYIIIRPDKRGFKLPQNTLVRISLVVILLVLYARLYEPLGFIISTALFCGILTRMLGAAIHRAAAFGICFGVIGHVLCVKLLSLNLPAGLLSKLL